MFMMRNVTKSSSNRYRKVESLDHNIDNEMDNTKNLGLTKLYVRPSNSLMMRNNGKELNTSKPFAFRKLIDENLEEETEEEFDDIDLPEQVERNRDGRLISAREAADFGLNHGTRFLLMDLKKEERRVFFRVDDVIDHVKKEFQLGSEFWIDSQACSVDEVAKLAKYFRFSKSTCEACETNHLESHDKWEVFQQYTHGFVTVASIEKSKTRSSAIKWPRQLRLPRTFLNTMLFSNCFLTFHDEPFHGFDVCLNSLELYYAKISGRQLELDETRKTPITVGLNNSPSVMLYCMLEGIAIRFMDLVETLLAECDKIDENSTYSTTGHLLIAAINNCKRKAIVLKKMILPKQRMLNRIVVSQHCRVPEDVQVYIRNLLDRVARLDLALDSLNEAHMNHYTKLQIDIARSTDNRNVLTNRLGSFALVYGPLTVIVGFSNG